MKSFFNIPDPEVEGYPVVWGPLQVHRYTLWRYWRAARMPRYIVWIGLNPSTATETTNDPTITRCIQFSKRWGFEAMVMLNLFAYRSTDPKNLKDLTLAKAIGNDNNHWITRVSLSADKIVACWGTNGSLHDRATDVTKIITNNINRKLYVLELNGDGSPQHPLYVHSHTTLKRWK